MLLECELIDNEEVSKVLKHSSHNRRAAVKMCNCTHPMSRILQNHYEICTEGGNRTCVGAEYRSTSLRQNWRLGILTRSVLWSGYEEMYCVSEWCAPIIIETYTWVERVPIIRRNCSAMGINLSSQKKHNNVQCIWMHSKCSTVASPRP